MGKFFSDFKEFAMRGNVVDMAVGVVIGAAFGKIVSSLVSEVIMPAVGLLTGGVNFADLKWVIKAATVDAAGTEIPEVAIGYGAFVQAILDFLIIAFCIFVLIRMLMKLKKKEEVVEEEAAPAAPTQEQLLTEIRDILKERD
ncbi:MAG: large-conductance mechanosensitive channel protein MscL [Muribaculaceae bacterium]|nr:large-conductance mechanosensitive channel protein MscL [Muribaculaceae bacterium]